MGRRLDLIGGFTAKVPQAALAAVRRAEGVEADPSGKKLTGAGIGVALIDSDVAPVEGLAGSGKVVNGPDLSFESQAESLRYLDTYGHGTHLAGIIAGKDPEVTPGTETNSSNFVGVAPGAHIVNVKVAAADGATDVSQVIAAIDWVVQHRNDPGLNIRVLNLSFGTDSAQDSRFDPLSHAVEVAWRKGIVVVVAVGNDGASQTRVSMPAANKYVIAVGAIDPKGTDSRSDDVVADFSTRATRTGTPTSWRREGRWSRCATRARSSTRTTRTRSSTASGRSGTSAAPGRHSRPPSSPAPRHCWRSSARRSPRIRSSGC